MSDGSNAGRTEDREMLRETLSRMQDETRRGMEELRRNPRTTADIETNAGFISAAQGKLRHLDEAMVRFDAGKYGQCLKCSGAILIERLTAIPFAAYCINCQKKLNRDRAGWGHAPHDDEWTIPDELEPSTERESRQSAGASEHLSIPEKRTCRIGSEGLPRRQLRLDDLAPRETLDLALPDRSSRRNLSSVGSFNRNRSLVQVSSPEAIGFARQRRSRAQIHFTFVMTWHDNS